MLLVLIVNVLFLIYNAVIAFIIYDNVWDVDVYEIV